MKHRLGGAWTLFGAAWLVGACIDGQDKLVGEVDPMGNGGSDYVTGGGGNGTGGSGSSGGSGRGGSGNGGCEPGEIVPLNDGCNHCTCGDDGRYTCTERECDECPPPAPREECDHEYHYIGQPPTDTCCYYEDPCTTPLIADGSAYVTFEQCMAGPSDYGRRGDCDGDPFTGYETDLQNSPVNCGSCGFVCGDTSFTQITWCEKGLCESAACEAGSYDCNDLRDDGCESKSPCSIE